MLNIINSSTADFKRNTSEKKVYVFGAGTTCRLCIDTYLNNECIAVVDNNAGLYGTCISQEGKDFPVISVDEFISQVKDCGKDNVALLVAVIFYAGAIIEQLDSIEELDGIDCYLHYLLRNYKSDTDGFVFSEGEQKIPKKLHYMWLGDKEIPDNLKRYIEGWHEKCPDYEIIKWDESNYDITCNDYMYEAYKSKAWGFVPDYARLDIVYKEGGIYLDTDIELLKNYDCLLYDDCFMGAGGNDQINLGSGFGAVKGHYLIGQMRDFYNDKHFINPDGSLNKLPCHHYQAPVFRANGFEVANKYQKKDGIVIYPASVLSPTGTAMTADFFSDKTLSIHHTELSWISENEKKALERTKEILKSRI